MKTAMFLKLTGLLALIALMPACDLFEKDKTLPADEAKIEVRSATQNITNQMDQMMTQPAMVSLNMLMELVGGSTDWDKQFRAALTETPRFDLPGLRKALETSLGAYGQKTMKEIGETGVYHYNFSTGGFDLINPDVDYLRLYYPADDVAYANQMLNAILTIYEMEYTLIEYEDEYGYYEELIPLSINMNLFIDAEEVMSLTYQAAYHDNGFPSSVTASLQMPPYAITESFSGSNRDYVSDFLYTLSGSTLMKHRLDIRYTADMENLEKLSGYHLMSPLRMKGSVNPAAMELCGEADIQCLNNQIDIELWQDDKDKLIGHLEFRMYHDQEWDEHYAVLVVVYEDGSFDLLEDIMGSSAKGLSHGFRR